MGQERSGIALLLGLLLLFSSFLGVLYAKKANYQAPIIPGKSKQAKLKIEPKLQQESTLTGLGTVSAGEIEFAIIPFIMAQDEEKIIELMRDLPAMTAHDILIDIRTNTQLGRDDFLKILYGAALNYSGNTDAQNTIFSLLLSYPALRRGAPLLYVAADSKQAKIIPTLLAWIAQQKQNNPWLETVETEALQYAVQENASNVLETIYSLGLKINPSLATQLLWKAIAERRDLNIIRFLIKHKADINYAQKGITILIQGVRTMRPKLVKLLVTTPGININAIADIQVGSALQEVIALEKLARRSNKKELKKLIQIEEILRNHGASQDE